MKCPRHYEVLAQEAREEGKLKEAARLYDLAAAACGGSGQRFRCLAYQTRRQIEKEKSA